MSTQKVNVSNNTDYFITLLCTVSDRWPDASNRLLSVVSSIQDEFRHIVL